MKRTTYLAPWDEFLDLPEPMPATVVRHAHPRFWRSAGYYIAFQAAIVASCVFFAAAAAWAIIGGLAVMGVSF